VTRFYATVEKRDNPELADRPVNHRGASRRSVGGLLRLAHYGVRSAMRCSRPWRSARKLRDPARTMAKYVRVGREVRHRMQTLTPLVEPLSIDEAFLDLAGTQRVHGMIPAKVLVRFAPRVRPPRLRSRLPTHPALLPPHILLISLPPSVSGAGCARACAKPLAAGNIYRHTARTQLLPGIAWADRP